MAVALARLFYMVRGINPMTDSAKPRTLKDQLESETADEERSATVDSERSEFSDFAKAFGGLTHREAHVFYTKHDFWRARAGVSQYASLVSFPASIRRASSKRPSRGITRRGSILDFFSSRLFWCGGSSRPAASTCCG
jgi:hypothetical protein